MITLVILNYNRPDNNGRILSSIEFNDQISEVIIWNNEESVYESRQKKVKWVNACQNWGLYPRYAMSLLAKNECVMIQDDDLIIPQDSISALYNKWQNARLKIHGLFGRRPNSSGHYADFFDHDNAGVEMVIGRCMMFKRDLVLHFFRWLSFPQIVKCHRTAEQWGCLPSSCDDIIFNYAVSTYSRMLNQVHNLPRQELDDKGAISHNKRHMDYRDVVMRTCETLKTFYSGTP